MATEKLLHTRIQLKYDTYANWTGDVGKAVVLKAGEVGICTIPAGANADGIQNPPHVMMKVGDGSTAFEALPWTSAKAADVHAWAKQASLPVETTGEGNAVTTIAWDAAKNGLKVTLGEKFATAAELKKVTEDIAALGDSYATDKELEDAVSALNTEIAKKADKTYVDEELAKKVDNDTFNTFKTNNTKAIEDAAAGAVADAKTETENQIKALNVTDTAVDGEYVSAVNEVEGKIVVSRKALPVDTLTEGSANGTVKFNGTDVAVHGLASAAYVTVDSLNTTAQGYANTAETNAKAEVTALANGAVKANTEAIAAMKDGENGFLAQAAADAKSKADKALEDAKKYADQAELDAASTAMTYTDGEIDKVEAALSKVVNGTTPVAEATHATNADKATDADKLGNVAADQYALKTYVDTAEEDAVKAAKAYTDEVKKAILTGDSTTELKEAYDTLVEIQQWIEGDGVNATELSSAIAAEAKTRGEEITRVEGLISKEAEDRAEAIEGVQDQIDALTAGDGKVKAAEKADVASGLDEAGIAQVEDIKVNNAGHADTTSGLDATAEAQVKGIKVDDAGHADYADTAATANVAKNLDANSSAGRDITLLKSWTKSIANSSANMEGITTAGGGNFGPDDSIVSPQVALYNIKTYILDQIEESNGYADDLIAGLDVTDAAVAGQYVSAVNEVDGKVVISRENLPTYTLTTGDNNGTVKFNGTEVAVAGLKSAAYTESSAYATAAQGAKADTAVQVVGTGSENGTIAVDGANVAVAGLKSAAYTEASAYATAAQGSKADTALQSIAAGTGLKVSTKADNSQTVEFDDAVVFVLNGGTATTYID